MTKKIDQGGCAFPVVVSYNLTDPGMSKLDWFTGQAIAGLMANPNLIRAGDDGGPACDPAMIAEMAFLIGLAVMEERGMWLE